MCDFSTFRQLVKNTFPDLICSVMMFEKGSGAGGEITMYRAKVSGQPIGAEVFATQSPVAQEVVDELIRHVARARQAVKQSQVSWMVARNGGSSLDSSRNQEPQQLRTAA